MPQHRSMWWGYCPNLCKNQMTSLSSIHVVIHDDEYWLFSDERFDIEEPVSVINAKLIEKLLCLCRISFLSRSKQYKDDCSNALSFETLSPAKIGKPLDSYQRDIITTKIRPSVLAVSTLSSQWVWKCNDNTKGQNWGTESSKSRKRSRKRENTRGYNH